jgi:hypothetical protein
LTIRFKCTMQMGKCMIFETAHDFFFHALLVFLTPPPLSFSSPCQRNNNSSSMTQESGLINKKLNILQNYYGLCCISIYINQKPHVCSILDLVRKTQELEPEVEVFLIAWKQSLDQITNFSSFWCFVPFKFNFSIILCKAILLYQLN